jgi:hypothetical protein
MESKIIAEEERGRGVYIRPQDIEFMFFPRRKDAEEWSEKLKKEVKEKREKELLDLEKKIEEREKREKEEIFSAWAAVQEEKES